MLNQNDEQRIKQIIRDEVPSIIERAIDRVEVKIDKVLMIVTRTDQELTLVKKRVENLEKRTTKIEKKVGIKPPVSSTVFA